MSQETNSTINNLALGLSAVRAKEKEMNELAKKDDTKVSDLRAAQMELQFKMGKLQEELEEFIHKEGLGEKFHMIDLIQHFWNKSKNTIVSV